MKKALLIGLVLGLVAAWAVPAMAVDLTASGWIGMRGYIFQNAMPAAPQFTGVPMVTAFNDEMGAFINARAVLGFKLAASEDLYAMIMLRMDSTRFGDDATFGNRWAAVGGSQIAVQVQEVFIDFRMPPKLPIWFRVGQQPVAIRPWLFYFNDAPGVSTRIMIEPIKLSVTGYYVKMADPDAWSAWGGSEFYAIDTKIPFAFDSVNIAPGVFFAMQKMRKDATIASPPGHNWGAVKDSDMYWLGVNVDGGIGPVKMQADFIYNFGTAVMWDPLAADANISSWLLNLTGSFVWQKLEFGVGFKYVQGEDAASYDTESFYLPGGPNFGSESPAISGDFIVWDNGWFTVGPGWPGMGLIDGPCNYWYGAWNVRGFAYFQALDWLKVGAQVGYIGDTVKNADAITGSPLDTDDIGVELDFGVNIAVYKGLNLETGFGYLIPGDALSGLGIEDPWALQSRLMYFF